LPSIEEIIPFKASNPTTKAPEWWEIYNGLKHNVGVNYRKATLQNIRNALAGAFLLNAIHIPSAVRLTKFGILKPFYNAKIGFGMPPSSSDIAPEVVEDWLKKHRGFWGIVETPLFIYNLEELLEKKEN